MIQIISQDTEASLYGRAFFYELAHVVFSGEPSKDLFAVLGSDDCVATLSSLTEDSRAMGELTAYCERVRSDAAFADGEADGCLSHYNRAIVGLGAKRKSHPWESAYTSSKKILFQIETLEVRNFYRAYGYLPAMYPKVADDHISLECAFLNGLARKMIEAFESGDGERLERYAEGQRAFLRDHLLKWIGSYAEDLHEDAPNSLYDLCAAALADFALRDAAFLGGLNA